jgi:hypothetical protein
MPGPTPDLHCSGITAGGKVLHHCNYDVAEGYDRYVLKEYYSKLPAINNHLIGSKTHDYGSLADEADEETDVTVTDAELEDFATVSLSVDTDGVKFSATVTAANTVTVIAKNVSGGTKDLGSATLSVLVRKKASISDKNTHFELLGTSMTSTLCTFTADRGGITMTTAGSDQHQSILTPHLDTNHTAWTGVKWGTENQVEWACSISTNLIDNQKVWAGLKLTNDQLVATDNDQLFFKFQTDATNSETFADFAKLHFIHSIGGAADYISQLPITVAANTTYHLKISIDSARLASIFVNGTQYDVTTTEGSTGGTPVDPGNTPTTALTNDVDLIPYIGIEAGDSAAEALDVHRQCISRIIFE